MSKNSLQETFGGEESRSGWYYLMYGISYAMAAFADDEAHGTRLYESGSPGGAK